MRSLLINVFDAAIYLAVDGICASFQDSYTPLVEAQAAAISAACASKKRWSQ